MCMIDDVDGIDQVSSYEFRRARKLHACGECGREINIGERYLYASGIYDHEPWDAKQCSHCHAATALLKRKCGGYLYGCVCADLEEHINENLPWSMHAARLVVAIKRQWRKFRAPGLMPLPIIPLARAS